MNNIIPTICLPWPDKALSPNARGHWSAKAKAAKPARARANLECLLANVPRSLTRPVMRVDFYPPDARQRDDDNLVGSFKNFRDGIADYLGTSDRWFRPHYFFHDPDPAKRGFIEVRLGVGQ